MEKRTHMGEHFHDPNPESPTVVEVTQVELFTLVDILLNRIHGVSELDLYGSPRVDKEGNLVLEVFCGPKSPIILNVYFPRFKIDPDESYMDNVDTNKIVKLLYSTLTSLGLSNPDSPVSRLAFMSALQEGSGNLSFEDDICLNVLLPEVNEFLISLKDVYTKDKILNKGLSGVGRVYLDPTLDIVNSEQEPTCFGQFSGEVVKDFDEGDAKKKLKGIACSKCMSRPDYMYKKRTSQNFTVCSYARECQKKQS